MKGILLALLLLLLSGFVWVSHAAASNSMVYNSGIAPIQLTDNNGLPSGFLNEYWKLVAEKTGLIVNFQEVASFAESLEMLRSGEVDFHTGIFLTKEQSEDLDYSLPVLELNYYLYTSTDMPAPQSLDETRGVVVGVVQDGYVEKYARQVVPANRLVIYKDVETLFAAALDGQIKVFLSSDAHLSYYLSKRNLNPPFHRSSSALYRQTYYGATAKRNSALMETVRKGQQSISSGEMQLLKERWLSFTVVDLVSPTLKTLTKEEIDWLKEHPVLRVSNEMDWPPFDFNREGKPMGLSIDLLDLIAQRLGIKLEYVSGYSWKELEEMMRAKELDILHSLNRSASREQFILFTGSYISNQTVIVTAKDNSTIKNASDLKGKTIAVVEGYNQKTILKEKVEGVKFVSVDSPLAALKSVSSGNADATIRYNGVASYLINHHLLTNLKFVNEFKIEGDNLNELFFGVRNDWPILRNILQKGLDSISAEGMSGLKRKWIYFQAKEKPVKQIAFTDEEREWLKNNPRITLGADFNWPPFDFVDKDGVHSGIASDYVKIIEQQTRLQVDVQAGVWSDIIERMKKGELDGLVCAVKTAERMAYLGFSEPYLEVPGVIITKAGDDTITSMDDLNGRTVSINKGSYMHDWLKERFPQITLHLSTSNEASLEAVSYGEADAYIGNLAVANYIIRKRLLTNLKMVKKLDDMVTTISVAISKDKPILLGIIQKVLDSLTNEERQAILDRWFIASTEETVSLTPKEKQWFKQNPVIRLSGDPGWAPVSFKDEKGEYVGIVPDYFALIEAKSGIQFSFHPVDKWSDALTALKDGQIDVIDAIAESEERGKLMDFTDVYLHADVVLISRDDINFLKGLEYVGRSSVGTVKNYITESYIRKDYPEIDLKLYDTAAKGLKALSGSEIDIFVIDIPTFDYYTKKTSLANLKISGLTPYSFSLAIGVRKGQPELVSILNKTLGLISQKEKNEVFNNWVTLKEALVDYSLLWKAIFVASVFMAVFAYWNRRLANEVSLRKVAEINALQASRAKSDFLANMSHEIRTPMNSVLGFAELLDNMITDPVQKSYLKSIRAGGESLLSIINDILDLSKIEAGKMGLKPESVSMKNLFEEMDAFFKNRMSQKKLEFSCQLPEDFPPHIFIDGIRLKQILINLIGNALKFTEKGSVVVRCDEILLSPDGQTVAFRIVVRDTGIGIPAEHQKRIFNKFEQQDDQDNMKYGGTGLGLSICENFMKMMNGSISVLSEVGKGASFILDFTDIPLADEVIKDDQQETLVPTGFKLADVLVVDDVKDNRELVFGHFQGSEITFHEAENGQKALDILIRQPVDLIFLDLRMPVLNGYETITRIRQDERLSLIPVIAVTASVMGEDLRKVHQYGFNGYLRKPIERQDLFRIAADYLPYMVEKKMDIADIELELPTASVTELTKFIQAVDTELLPEWHDVKDRGDFELIGSFAEKIIAQAESCSVTNFAEYAKLLSQNVESFEIVEVDSLMRKFPRMIEKLKERLSEKE